MKPVLRVYPDRTALDRAAAALVVELLSPGSGRRSLALSGGATPRGLFGLLASPEFSSKIAWPEVDVYWTDERCVPPDHPDSNYGMARDLLLSKVPVREANVHRMRGELEPAEAAGEYEARLRLLGRGCDVVLLGVGEDGHTASLFPGTSALTEKELWAAANASPKGSRVTMTFPFLNLSENVLVLASGKAKAPIVAAAATGFSGPYPVQSLEPKRPPVWLVDREAAGDG